MRRKLRKWAAQTCRDVPAVWLALRRSDTPLLAKALSALAVAYALSPIDLIPDFIPVLGYLDDLVLLPLLVCCAVRRIPAPILAECRRQADTMWPNGRPKRWFLAVPIVVVWMALALLIARTIWASLSSVCS